MKRNKNVCYEPDKGPFWEWALIFFLYLSLVPVAWFLRLFVEKQRAYDLAFFPVDRFVNF